MGPPDEVWITPWITVTNWSWMEKGFVSLKKTKDLVEDLEAVLAPGPGLAAAPGPAAGPGPAAAPDLAARAGQRTGPSLGTAPGPGLLTDLVHAPTRNQNQSLVQDLVLNPGIKQQQQHYKKHKRKQETTINNNRFFMVILKRPYYTCTNIALLSRLL